MELEVSYFTDKGLRRESNQDSLLVNKELGLFIVADGMGGHSGGEVASSMAVETVEEVMLTSDFKRMMPREAILHAYEEASSRIFNKAALTNPELAGMGTTMVIALIRGDSIYIGNVGDSRCYLFKKPYLWQITEDHSLLNEQIRSGFLSEEQITNFVGKNVITRSVGYEKEVQPDILERQILAGETYLLCSDGLSGLVGDPKISDILNAHAPEKAARLCLEQALKNGGDDNVTVLALHFKV
jgi:protein phosphatase